MTKVPNNPGRRVLVHRLAASGQWDRVLEAARDWLADDPESAPAHQYVAQALINLERRDEALAHLEKLLSLEPGSSIGHRMMAMVQFSRKKYSKANKAIHEAITLAPESSQNWYYLAWMCYSQKDLKNGLKWANKARELDPLDSNTLNLIALCQGKSFQSPKLFEEVLAADPENPFAHNNLGVYYLETAKDYEKAEECFRHALTLRPGLKPARRNLFLAIKHRDRIYRGLCAPLDGLLKFRNFLFARKGRNIVAIVVGVLVWIFLVRFFILGVLLWLTLVWPMVKFYEFLVIGDLRKRAGEVGATRGGIFGYRRWAVKTRLAIFAVGLAGFWTTLYFLGQGLRLDASENEVTRLDRMAWIVMICAASLGVFVLVRLWKRSWSRYHAWNRDRKLRKLDA